MEGIRFIKIFQSQKIKNKTKISKPKQKQKQKTVLCLWCVPAALIRPLPWEFPYASGMALKKDSSLPKKPKITNHSSPQQKDLKYCKNY